MPENYILLERTELNASAASVTFSNIPQTGYTDLKIVFSARDNTSGGGVTNNIYLQFNGSGGTAYSGRLLYGTGSSAFSVSNSTNAQTIFQYSTSEGATANTFSNGEIYIPNYTSSNAKSISADSVTETNATGAVTALSAGLWTGTAAITSVTLTPFSGSFIANSTFSLYGIAAVGTTPAIAPKASGGNIIDYDGTNWIHIFLTSGTFIPQVGLSCDYLVIAGGGGGGASGGGGGGAGGYRSSTSPSGGNSSGEGTLSLLSNTNYAVTIGAGGAGGGTSTVGTTGSNSILSTITSNGGGGGGNNSNVGISGGSGGGGGGNVTTPGNPTTNQGFIGGTGNAGAGGGGGGAGEAGNTDGQQFGGDGLQSSITGTSVFRAGGGAANAAGKDGGLGGGGNGSTSGTTNTGGGGGAWDGSGAAGAGGSGIVIIRYPAA
jgi:hypothetical protein